MNKKIPYNIKLDVTEEEGQLIASALKKERRSLRQFCTLATLKMAEEVLHNE